MKQVNLEEILEKHLKYSSTIPPGRSFYLGAMQEACNQTVDLCAENAETDFDLLPYEEVRYYVDKQSILDTKKQII